MRKIPLWLLALGLHPLIARAQIDLDTSPKGVFYELMDSDDATERSKRAKSLITDYKEAERLLRVKADPNELRQLQVDVKSLKAEHQLYVETEQKLYTQLTSDKSFGELLKNSFAGKESELTALAQKSSDRVSGLDATTGAVAGVTSAALALANTPFKLIATASLNAKNEMAVKFSIDPKSIDLSLYSSAVTNTLSPEDMRSVLAELNKALGEGEGSFLTPSEPSKAFETLTSSKFLAKLRDQQLLSRDAKLKTVLGDAKAKIGDPRKPDPDSKLGGKLEEIKDKSDNSEKDEQLKELATKRKLAEWLRNNDPGDMDACEAIVKAVGSFALLPKATQRECEEFDPVKKAAADAAAKKLAEADKQADAADAQKGAALVSLSQQLCQSLVASRAAQTGIKAVKDLVEPIYAQMESQGFGSSTLFGQLAGDAVILNNCVRAYQARQALNPQVPMPNTCDNSEFLDKAASMARGYANDAAGTAELQKERKALAKILSTTGYSLAALEDSSPLGLADPAFAGNEKVMGILRNKMTASTLLEAVDAELATRTAANKSRLRSVGPGSGGGGVPVVGAGGAGAIAPTGAFGNGGGGGGQRPADAARNLRMNSPQTNGNFLH